MCDNSFPSRHHLLKAEEFDAVFQNRDFSVSSTSLLFLASRNDLGFNRLGLVISKKNLPRAVDRNRVKRVIRESFRTRQLPGLDVVALARSPIRYEQDLRTVADSLFADLVEKESAK